MVCEGGEELDVDNMEEDHASEDPLGSKRKKTHGGCGHKQPPIRKEGLKLYTNFKPGATPEVRCLLIIIVIIYPYIYTIYGCIY